MGARFRSWRQQIKIHPMRTVLIALLSIVIVLIVLSILGYIFNWTWTGLGPYVSPPHPKDSDFQRGKTLWDWLQLLIIPAVLAVAGYIINLTISRGEQAATEQRAKSEREAAEKRAETERQIAKERYEQDQQIALDKQREDLLQTYLDRMSELLLNKQLRTSEPDSEVRNVARARTLTVLPLLDTQRKGNLLQFLSESKLQEIINLRGADLGNANLGGCNLEGADLKDTILYRIGLHGANMKGADMKDTNLVEAYLGSADLSDADLSGAVLLKAELNDADLSDANLNGAYLRDANLNGVTGISVEKLEKQAKSLKGATMPDGTIHP